MRVEAILLFDKIGQRGKTFKYGNGSSHTFLSFLKCGQGATMCMAWLHSC